MLTLHFEPAPAAFCVPFVCGRSLPLTLRQATPRAGATNTVAANPNQRITRVI